MKALFKSLLAMSCFMILSQNSIAQQLVSNIDKLNLGSIKPYQVAITYNKTTHLLFPAGIRYVDLGSDFLIAGKAEDAENVLRVKASLKDFEGETNFSVITEDGRFYNFNVYYSSSPSTLNYDLLTMQKMIDRENVNDVLFKELKGDSGSLAELIMQTIYKSDKRNVMHIGSKSFGIQFLLKGIYVQDDKFFFHTELRNKSNLPFHVDFMTFKVVDKKVGKRTVLQEKALQPLRIYQPLGEIGGKATDQNVFLLDQFTITDDKILILELFEKNGGRQQVLKIENSDLVNAKVVESMNLKIN